MPGEARISSVVLNEFRMTMTIVDDKYDHQPNEKKEPFTIHSNR